MALVLNLATLEERSYSCEPREAVIAAYAQEWGDWNTWEYKQRYGALVEEGRVTLLCGDWSAFKDGREG